MDPIMIGKSEVITPLNNVGMDSDDIYMSSFSKERQELQYSIASLNKIHRQFFRTSGFTQSNNESKML